MICKTNVLGKGVGEKNKRIANWPGEKRKVASIVSDEKQIDERLEGANF